MSTNGKKPVEKGDEYWSFVDSLLDNFDDTKAHAPRPRTPVTHTEPEPHVTAEEAAAAVATATAPVVEEPVITTTRASEADASEAKSSGEAPAAGGYFLPRKNAPKAPRPSLHLSTPEETVLPTVLPEAAPVVEAPVVEAPVVEEPVVEAPVVETPVAEEPAPEEPIEETLNRFFHKNPAEPVAEVEPEPEAPDIEYSTADIVEPEAPAAEVSAPAAPVDEPVPAEPKLSRAERKAQKKAQKQAEKEARAAEKRAAKEAKETFAWEGPAEERVSLEEALEGPAAPAAPAYDADARNAEFDATYVEKKSGGALKVLRNIVITLAALAIVACLAVLGYNFAQDKLNARQFEQASTLVQQGLEADDLASVRMKYPDISFPADMSPAFGELYAQNQDLTGWIRIVGTNISYPVVQTDNDTFYQNHNFTKASSPYGTPFLSTKNDASDLDLNTVVYGQNSAKEPRMFGDLEIYRTKDGFLSSPVLEYSTLTTTYAFKVYGVFITNAAPEQDNGYVFDYTVPNLGTVESFAGYIDQVNERRLYDTGVDIESTDKLLTLSTSVDDFEGARLVVVGRLLRADESATVKASKVKTNKSPRYPQAYYDAAGKENPYKDADNWIPTVS